MTDANKLYGEIRSLRSQGLQRAKAREKLRVLLATLRAHASNEHVEAACPIRPAWMDIIHLDTSRGPVFGGSRSLDLAPASMVQVIEWTDGIITSHWIGARDRGVTACIDTWDWLIEYLEERGASTTSLRKRRDA